MTHRQRIAWLKSRGYDAQEQGRDIPQIGLSVWIDGPSRVRPVSLWLAVNDGRVIIHGPGDEILSWADAQEWIEPTKEPERKKPFAAQRNLFGDEE